jgi:hypothetical protein
MSTLRANMLLITKRMRTDELEQYETAMPMSALLFYGGADQPHHRKRMNTQKTRHY